MFNNSGMKLLYLSLLAVLISGSSKLYAADTPVATINTADLPINVSDGAKQSDSVADTSANALVSPSKTITSASDGEQKTEEKNINIASESKAANEVQEKATSGVAVNNAQPKATNPQPENNASNQDDFNFDLKMKSISNSGEEQKTAASNNEKADMISMNVTQPVPYSTNPVDNLSNSILSQIDSDLFSQMSEIEKSTTLLTLELRREKIRNEIEAQKAVRQKAYDDREREKAAAKLKDLEQKKQIEAQVLREKQLLVDKEQLLEVLKQRKLLNAYMNQMLVMHQTWLKEKENLYAQLAAVEGEKKELIGQFKQKLDKVLEASAKNIQAAEAAKANFERIISGLKARNEQLRKRIEADAKIIKSAKNSLYLKSQSIEELKEKNAANAGTVVNIVEEENLSTSAENEIEELPAKLSSQYALLGITGRADSLSIEVIDVDGQPVSLRVGSPLPTGHVLSEIGSDYAKFSRDGKDEYLYIGRTIDGFIPVMGLLETSKK